MVTFLYSPFIKNEITINIYIELIIYIVSPRGYFFDFSGTYAGGGGAKNCPKKYNIDYFGHAANLEVKFKLNFD